MEMATLASASSRKQARPHIMTPRQRETFPPVMLLVIPQLVWPEILVEVEVIAAKA
jgi:hypothetical protein